MNIVGGLVSHRLENAFCRVQFSGTVSSFPNSHLHYLEKLPWEPRAAPAPERVTCSSPAVP